MKKLLFFLSLFVSVASFGQQIHTHAFEQTIKNGNILTQGDTIQTATNQLVFNGGGNFMVSTSVYGTPKSILAEGNSITAGQNASPTSLSYINLFASYMGLSITNDALSGSGIWNSTKDHLLNVNPGHTFLTTVMAGFNDVRRNGVPPKTTNKVCNGINAIAANQWLASYLVGGTANAAVTRYGSWTTNYAGTSVGGKSVNNGAYTSTLNDSLVYSFTDSTVVLGLIGQDSTNQIGAAFTVYIDNVLKTTSTENLQTDGISDGVNNNRIQPMALIYTGLGYSAHKIKIIKTSSGSNFLIVDYVGNLVPSSAAMRLVVFEAPKMDATGYATSPANANDAVINAINSSIDSTIALLPTSYPVSVVKTNNYYIATTASGLSSSDHIHPNNTGHTQILNAAKAAVLPFAKANFGLNVSPATVFHIKQDSPVIRIDDSKGTISAFIGNFLGYASVSVNRNPSTAVYTDATKGSAQFSMDTAGKFHFYAAVSPGTNPAEFSTLLPTAFFGLGTTTPAEKIHIIGPTALIRMDDTTSANNNAVYYGDYQSFGQFAINRNPGTGVFKNSSFTAGQISLQSNTNNSKIHFFTTTTPNVIPTEAMTIVGNHDVLIGDTTDRSTALNQITSASQPQIALHYDATHYTTLQTNSSGNYTIAPSGGQTTLTGSVAGSYRAITAIRTLDATDYMVNCTANSFTVTLPTAVGCTGRMYIIKNTGSSTTITIATTSSQTIDGTTPGTITTLVPLRVMSDGANWITW